MIDWPWILDNKIMIGELLWQHVQLVIVALFFGTLFTGVLISLTLRWPAAAQPLIYLCGILFTIPSLALFILLLPFTGLSLMTSIIGLTLYSLLILLRNVIAGIEKLPATVLESARAGLYPLVSFCRYRAASAAALAVRRVTHRFGDAGRAGDGHRLNWPGRSRAASVSRV